MHETVFYFPPPFPRNLPIGWVEQIQNKERQSRGGGRGEQDPRFPAVISLAAGAEVDDGKIKLGAERFEGRGGFDLKLCIRSRGGRRRDDGQ
jgi:hypothetical protein